LNARGLTTLLCKQIVTKSKDVKTECNLAESSSKEDYGSKMAVLPMIIIIIIIIIGQENQINDRGDPLR
jgi:hypothetical protein